MKNSIVFFLIFYSLRVFAQEGIIDINLNDSNISNEVRAHRLARLNTLSNHNIVEITHSIEGPYFVEGVTGVYNNLEINNEPPATNSIQFFITSSDYSIVYSTSPVLNVGQNYLVDMGGLKPGIIIWAALRDNQNNIIEFSSEYIPYIIEKPIWLKTSSRGWGYVSNVLTQQNSTNMKGNIVFNVPPKYLPTYIPGLGGRPYGIDLAILQMDITYDHSDKSSVVQNPKFIFQINPFDLFANKPFFSLNLNELESSSFDTAFNPNLYCEDSIEKKLFDAHWSGLSIPVLGGFANVKIPVGLRCYAGIKGKVDFGINQDGDNWDIRNSSITTYAKAIPSLSLGFSDCADGIASLKGTLVGAIEINSGFEYNDNSNYSQIFNGRFSVSGNLSGNFLMKRWQTRNVEIINKSFPSVLNSRFVDYSDDRSESVSLTRRLIQSNPILKTPEFFSEPFMNANDSALYCVWLDYSGPAIQLLLSKLDYNTRYFSDPVIVAENEMISNPKVTTLPSGNAIVSWTQNRYTSDNFDTSSMNIYDLLKGQDIWVSHYDKTTNTADDPIRIFDDSTSLGSGRAEGNANIIMGKGNYGLLTWVAKDYVNAPSSDVWYSALEETPDAEVNTTSIPSKITDMPGVNKSVRVSFYDSTNAIAMWINDPDGDDSTLNDIVVMRFWDQNSQAWEDIDTLISNDGTFSIQELSNDFNGIYGGFAITYTQYDTLGNFQKKLRAFTWDSNLDEWSSYIYEYYDSNKSVSQPSLSVNKNGIVSLTYQTTNLFLDSAEIDPGKITLVVNDSKNHPDVWNPMNSNNNLLGDSSVFDWSINTTYGEGNNFYIITQEADNITGNAPLNPPFGVRFGRDSLNLVLRVLDVTPAGINDVREPDTKLYTFTGNGNWSDSSNWKNNEVPPMHLPEGSHILIDPIGGGACKLNVTQYVNGNSSITISAGKKFIIPGKLEIQ